MLIQTEITVPDMEALDRVDANMESVYRNAGEYLARCIRNHMRVLNETRRSPLNATGRSSNHFSPDKVLEPVVNNNSATVEVAIPGITRAYHDIDIYPKEASALAIPLHYTAYGMSPRENNDRGIYKLFRINRKGSTEKGNVLFRNGENGELIPMYSLVTHVHQVQDPSLMPSNEQLTDEAIQGATEAIKSILSLRL